MNRTSAALDLTIIIVNWNGGQMLRDCLASLRSHHNGLEIQVIVVDNASRDGSRDMAEQEFPEFTVVNSGSNLGFGRANNLARPLVKSDLVLFLNPDTVVLQDSLRTMARFMRNHTEVGGLGCKMRSPSGEVHDLGWQAFLTPWIVFCDFIFGETPIRRWFDRSPPPPDPLRSGYVTKLYGGCLLCRKPVLDEVGWFDERYFMYAEDVDLCHAILAQGSKLYYISDSEIIHVGGGTSNKAPSGFSILMKSDSVAKFMRKHHGRSGALFYRIAVLAGAAFRLLVLALLRALAVFSTAARQAELKSVMLKQRNQLLWSLGIKKPQIAS